MTATIPETTQAAPKVADLFANAICISVERGKLGNSRKLKDFRISEKNGSLLEDKNAVVVDADKELIRVSKRIFQCGEYTAIRKLDNRVHGLIKTYSLPAMLKTGMYLVPMSKVEFVEQQLEAMAEERKLLVEAFLKVYPKEVENAAIGLRGCYDSADYPPANAIAGEFYFTWNWLDYGAAGKLKSISAKMLEAEREKMAAVWTEAKDVAEQLIAAELLKTVEHIQERMADTPDGKKKIIQKGAVEKLNAALDLLDIKNITDSAQIKELVAKAKAVIGGVNDAALKSDEFVRQKVSSGFAEISTQLAALVELKPKRAYKFDEE
jgi:hypothetical protein